jgi:acetyl-CoA C-acetyltransferase
LCAVQCLLYDWLAKARPLTFVLIEFLTNVGLMRTSVIVAGARTPIGRFNGSLSSLSGTDLGGLAIKAAVERAGIASDQVQYVIMGQVLQAGAGQGPARQAGIKGGLPMDVPSITVNKVCLSGLNAIALADQLIRAGEFDVIVAGGMESMTNAPHLLMNSRTGFKLGDVTMKDSMLFDGLFCAIDQIGMGDATDKNNARYSMTREAQDEFAFQSHQRAAKAQAEGVFDSEFVQTLRVRGLQNSSQPFHLAEQLPPVRPRRFQMVGPPLS